MMIKHNLKPHISASHVPHSTTDYSHSVMTLHTYVNTLSVNQAESRSRRRYYLYQKKVCDCRQSSTSRSIYHIQHSMSTLRPFRNEEFKWMDVFKQIVTVVHWPTCVEWTLFVAMYDTRYVFYCGLCPTEHVVLGWGAWDVTLIGFVLQSANANLNIKLDTRWARKHECRSTINVSVRRPPEVLNWSSDGLFFINDYY